MFPLHGKTRIRKGIFPRVNTVKPSFSQISTFGLRVHFFAGVMLDFNYLEEVIYVLVFYRVMKQLLDMPRLPSYALERGYLFLHQLVF